MKTKCSKEFVILSLFHDTWTDRVKHEEELDKVNEVFVENVNEFYNKQLITEEEKGILMNKVNKRLLCV